MTPIGQPCIVNQWRETLFRLRPIGVVLCVVVSTLTAVPDAFESSCCAEFALSRDRIRQHPLKVYQTLQDGMLNGCKKHKDWKGICGDRGQSVDKGIEPLWRGCTS
jgi:hypothetical protein